jgi:cell division protein FtsI/penicillin-binding protein 2/cell division protein FtsW (lipid II flippase)
MVWRTRGRSGGWGWAHGPVPSRQRRTPRLRGGRFDLVAVVAALVLTGVGIANVWVVDGPDLAARQTGYALTGLLLGGVLGRWRVRRLGGLSWACYGLALVLLGAVMVAGTSVNGATRWLSVGSFTFQPSELAKVGLLLALAAVLGSSAPPWRRFVLAVPVAVVPIGLTLGQPDLSTCALLISLTVGMLILARIPARLLLPLFAAGALAAPMIIGLLQPYQAQRLGSFIAGSHESATGAGWAVTQARIAIGSSGLLGPGHQLTDLLAQYLPERHTDLAVASVVEQFGMIVGAAVVLASIALVWRLALATGTPRSPPGALLAGGLALLFGVETVVSLGGNLGMLPLAGIPFPLLSYGGSALVVHLATLGVALGVRRDGERRRLWKAPRWLGRRPRWVLVCALCITVSLLMFGGYGWRVRAADGLQLTSQGIDQMTRCMRLPAPRGEITDRHGVPLATTAADALADIIAVPAVLDADPPGLTRLAALVGQSPDAIRATLRATPATTPAVSVARLPAPAAGEVAKAGIAGVSVIPGQRRTYPAGAMLGSVLGFTGVATPAEHRRWPELPLGEVVGRTGLEQQYDAVLRGVDGSQCVYVDPVGRPVAMGPRTEPVPGANLRLSIDIGLQRVLSDGVARAMRGQPGRVGAAVAMDPRNGQLLALAGVPGYDNNIYGPPADTAALGELADAPGSPMLVQPGQSAVPPGSTFKLVVAAANQVHPVLPADKVVPTGGSYTLGGHTFNNWKPMGPMNLVQALAWSNDVYFYKMAVALGPDAVIDTARALGVGRPTGIDLPAESPGYLGTPESVRANDGTWYLGSTVILGIGQGYLTVTPLQNARWTAAVASGRLVTPRLGLATGAGNTWASLPAPAPVELPFAGALGPVRAGMRAVVTGGTGASLASLPAPVGAKTGTAEDGSLPSGSYDNWITAAAPFDDPGIVITVLTQGSGGGANSATTVGREGLAYYLDHRPQIEQTAPTQSP